MSLRSAFLLPAALIFLAGAAAQAADPEIKIQTTTSAVTFYLQKPGGATVQLYDANHKTMAKFTKNADSMVDLPANDVYYLSVSTPMFGSNSPELCIGKKGEKYFCGFTLKASGKTITCTQSDAAKFPWFDWNPNVGLTIR
jgi:hypothetical protein